MRKYGMFTNCGAFFNPNNKYTSNKTSNKLLQNKFLITKGQMCLFTKCQLSNFTCASSASQHTRTGWIDFILVKSQLSI